MPEEQVVQVVGLLNHFAERGSEQASPELAFDLHRRVVLASLVESSEAIEMLLESWTRAQALAHFVLSWRDSSRLKRLRLVAQPFEQLQAVFGGCQRECIRRLRTDRSHPGPAQNPVLAVGQDAEALRLSARDGFLEVGVELLHMDGIGCDLIADAHLELDDQVASAQVDPS